MKFSFSLSQSEYIILITKWHPSSYKEVANIPTNLAQNATRKYSLKKIAFEVLALTYL